MNTLQRLLNRGLLALFLALSMGAGGPVSAQAPNDETPTFPGDVSVAGLAALDALGELGEDAVLPEGFRDVVRQYVSRTRALGLTSRSGRVSLLSGPTNVRANDPTGDAIGETQAEVAVAVNGDTVVVGWNDSKGFLVGFTVSSFAYSVDGGVTFVDGGNVPLELGSDGAFGDPGVDTDERGNWYYNQIYTRAPGAPGPTAQQNIGVHHGRFNALGQLVWDLPTQASIGTPATGALDKCLLGVDRLTGNVYTAYTRFTANPRIEIVRSTTLGATWDAPVVLDAGVTPTASKQAARPICGPNGEVYVVWEKGANIINCPDGAGNVANTSGVIGFARSLDFGVTYDPAVAIGNVGHAWTWSGPGDLRERGNDFPDIAVDRSGGPFNGSVYVTWHESAPWASNIAAGPISAETNNAANEFPITPETFTIGDNVTGTISSNADLDYWQFSAVQGQSLLFNLDPQGFNCGVSGTTRGMRLRLFATQGAYTVPTAFPDSLLAASALGTFAQRIVWTAPRTGTYLVRLQRTSGVAPFTYLLRVRTLAFGAPSAGRDARDVVVIRSNNQGLTWTPELLLNDSPVGIEERRPFIAVDGLGHVHAFWHDSRVPGLGSNAALTSIHGHDLARRRRELDSELQRDRRAVVLLVQYAGDSEPGRLQPGRGKWEQDLRRMERSTTVHRRRAQRGTAADLPGGIRTRGLHGRDPVRSRRVVPRRYGGLHRRRLDHARLRDHQYRERRRQLRLVLQRHSGLDRRAGQWRHRRGRARRHRAGVRDCQRTGRLPLSVHQHGDVQRHADECSQ